MTLANSNRPYAIAITAGLLYGLSLRLMFHQMGGATTGTQWFSHFYPTDLWVMTAGFLICVPFAVGWITSAAATPDRDYHWSRWIFTPWFAVALTVLCALVTGIEGVICVIFAIPITLVFSSLGGVAGGLVARNRFLHRGTTTLCIAVFPIFLAAAEMQSSGPVHLHTTQTSILIHAPAATVFHNIERVPAIAPSELRPTWTHRIGFPLPVEATLDHEGIGGIRHASFEHGLLFIETITAWETNRRIAFTIAADTAHIPPTTLDEHVTIGGRYFDVLNGEYRLEPLANGDILLHLSSQQRLSTDFNAYATLWSDAVMRNLQNSILEVVQHRCESAPLSATLNP